MRNTTKTVAKGIPANSAEAAAIPEMVAAQSSANKFRGTIDGLKQYDKFAQLAGCQLGEVCGSFLRRASEQARPAETTLFQPRPNAAAASLSNPIERIYFAWDEALSRNDADALLALYADDAHLESPLVPYLLNTESGMLHGHKELRPLFELLAARKPTVRQYFRTAYLTDGKRLIWEYPRQGPEGGQMDFVEAMDLNDQGLIQRHCVYWGWFGFGVLKRDEYHR